jgi:hypothetical protein
MVRICMSAVIRGFNTHCGGDPVEEEGLVPLVVISRAVSFENPGLADATGRPTRNRSSHYNIFPTLLQLMGYDLTGIEAVYGKPLERCRPADDFTFNYRFNARLGAKPEWKHIDLNTIVTPGAGGIQCGGGAVKDFSLRQLLRERVSQSRSCPRLRSFEP